VLFCFCNNEAFSNVTITTATNGTINTCAFPSAYQTLGDIIITEGANGDFTAGTNVTLILTAPTNFSFNAGVGNVTFSASKNITAASIVVTSSIITITYSSSGTNRTDILTISGIQILANNFSSSGNILRTSGNPGTGTIAGITNGTTNFGTLTSTLIAPSSPSLNIAITSGSNPMCPGNSATFTATPTNGGTTPAYQWKLNGGNVGTNSSTYTNASLLNSDQVSCVLTSNAPCVSPTTATSNTITMTVSVPADPGNPTSNSPQCASPGVTLTRSGTPPAGETWYWQTSASGTSTTNSGSTYNVTTSGTYYIRSQNNTSLCWSSGAGSLAITINAAPATATTPSPANAATGVCYSGGGAITSISWATVSGAVSYDVYFGAGSLPGTLTSNVATNSYSTGTLAASTTYYWKVVPKNASCDAIGAVTWTFTTAASQCAITYCSPAPTSVDGTGITNVTCGTINNSTGVETNNYGNYSAQVATYMQSTTVTVNITFSTGYTYETKIWVDWNDNGDFTDAGENVYTGTSLSANPTTLVATFTVPIAAIIGNHRMRIGGADVGPPTPCYTGTYASFEDYTLNVIAATPMSYSSCTTTQVNTTSVFKSSTNQEVIGMQIITTGISNPISATSFSFNTTGTQGTTAPSTDITNAKLWYTGASSTFAATTQVGSTVASPNGVFTITPTQTLSSGTNYFWLTYDIPASATVNNYIDAACSSITVSAVGHTPTATSPTGSRQILCPAPSTQASIFTSSNLSANSMTVGWTRGNGTGGVLVVAKAGSAVDQGPTNYNTYTANAAFGSGTQLGTGNYVVYSGTGTSVNLTALSSGVTYYFAVYEYNAACSYTYMLTTPLTGNATTCSTQSLTYSQGFNATSIPACWSVQNVVGSSAILFVASSSSPTTTPQEGTDYVNWNSNSYTAGQETRLVSAAISSTGTSSVDVEFYWNNENSTSYNSGAYLNEGVQVQYSLDGTTWINAGSLVARYDGTLASGTNQWKLKTITLPAGAGNQTTIYVGLKFHSEYGHSCSLDNLVIKPTPSCLSPTAVTSSSVTATTATISWTASTSSPSNGYQYEIRTSGAAGSGATGLTTSGNTAAGVVTANITGLTANMTYYVYVRSDCGGSNYSSWTSSYSFTTPCLAISSYPWTENFDAMGSIGAGIVPGCWLNATGTKSFYSSNAAYTTYNDPRSAANYMTIKYGNTTSSYLWTPGFQMTAGNTYVFSFYFAGDGYSGWTGDVVYNTAQTSSGATALGSSFITSSTTSVATYTLVTNNFIAPTTGTYYFAVKSTSTSAPYDMGFDDFSMTLLPLCTGTPAAGTASASISPFCLGQSTTLSLTGYTVASGISFQWQSSSALAGPFNNIGGATSLTYVATPSATTYYRCVTTCSNGGGTNTSNVVTVTMNPPISCYCTSNATSTADEEILNVQMGTLNNTSNCSQTGGTGSILNEYSNYTSVAAPNLAQGSTVAYSVQVGTCGSTNYANGVSIWIDYNQDGDYADAGENVYYSAATTSGPHIESGNIIVPLTATVGTTGMRVIVKETSVPTNPCGTYGYGETEDYLVNITAAVACSGTPTAGTATASVTSFCNTGSSTLTVSGYSVAIGLTFQWQLSTNGGSTWSNISGATATTYNATNINTTTLYHCIVTCTNSGLSATSSNATVTNNAYLITGTNSPVTVVCNTAATMTATSSGGTINWYASATGGSVIATGGSYSPTVNANTTYYCATSAGGSSSNIGKTTSPLSDGYYGYSNYGLVFDAISAFTLVSVKVYVQTAGNNVSIQLQDNTGSPIGSAINFPSLPAGINTLTLNLNIPIGTGYKLVSTNSTYLARDYSASYPYTQTGVCSITGGWTGSSSSYYYYFYDWVITTACESSRTPVNVIVSGGVSAPACASTPSPANGATAVCPVDVTISWAASMAACATATGYKLYFGTDAAATDIMNGIDIGNVTSYNLGDLSGYQLYYWRAVPYNTAGDATSCITWTFTTASPGTITSYPYDISFDDVTAPNIPCGMNVTNDNNDTKYWQTAASNARSNPNCIKIDYHSTNAMNDWFFSKRMQMTAGTTYQVTFWYKTYNSTSNEALEVKWGTSPTAAGMTGGSIYTNSTLHNSTYTQVITTFTPPSSGFYYAGWHGFSPTNLWYIYIDDIRINILTNPDCAGNISPSDAATNIGTTCNSLNWSVPATGGDPSGYKLYYGTNTPPSNIVNGTNLGLVTTYDIGTLSASTTYYWKVVPTNAVGDAVGCPIWTFTTGTGGNITSYPYTQNFDGVTAPALPCGITQQSIATIEVWETTSDESNSGVNSAYIDYNSSFASDDWLFLPAFTFTGSDNYLVSFWYQSGSSYYTQKLEVKWGTSASAAGMTNGPIYTNINMTNTSFAEGTGAFTPGSTGTYYIGFHGFSNSAYGGALYLDDIKVQLCMPIANNTIAAAQTICANTAPAALTGSIPTGGTGNYTYQWQSSPDNSTWANISSAVSQNYTPTTLISNTYFRRVVSSSGVTPSISTAILITVNPLITPSIVVSTSTPTICQGASITFTAAPTNGGTPVYQWKNNGSNVGSNSSSFTTSTLSNYDVINCVMTSTATCASPTTATSNDLLITITNCNPNDGLYLSGNFTNNGTIIHTNDPNYCIMNGTTKIIDGTGIYTDFKLRAMGTTTFDGIISSGSFRKVLIDPTFSFTVNTARTFITGTSIVTDSVTNNGTLTILDNSVFQSACHWINNATATAGTGSTILFNSAIPQNVKTNATVFYNWTVNNSSTAGVYLLDDANTSKTLTFIDGIINTDINKMICTSTLAADITGDSYNSYINGNLRKYIASNTSTYRLPVGTIDRYRLAEIVNNNLTGPTYLDAKFLATFTNTGSFDVAKAYDPSLIYGSLAPEGIWQIDPNSAPAGGNYGIKLWFNGGAGAPAANAFQGLLDNEFGALKRSSASGLASDWTGQPIGTINSNGGTGRMLADGYALRFNITTFSHFGIGKKSTNLPVELLSFAGYCSDDKVNLLWSTASEVNNDFFTIERSVDGINFDFYSNVNGHGYSNIVNNYSTIDEQPLSDPCFYRLKQTDFDGAFSYFVPIAVSCNSKVSFDLISIISSNEDQAFNITILANLGDKYTVCLYDITGNQLIKKSNFAENTGLNKVKLPFMDFGRGIYLITLEGENTLISQKVLLN